MTSSPRRETDLSAEVISRLSGENLYRPVRVETAIDDGWSDLLLLSRSTGLPIFLEMKVAEIKADHFLLKTLQSSQVNFLYEGLQTPGSRAGLLFSVAASLYCIHAERSADWIRRLNSKKIHVSDPIVHSIPWSGIGAALALALPCAVPAL